MPSGSVKTATVGIGDEVERSRRKVDVVQRASLAAVNNRDRDFFTFKMNDGLFATDWVVVWIGTPVSVKTVVQEMADSGDHLAVIVCPTTSSETNVVKGELACERIATGIRGRLRLRLCLLRRGRRGRWGNRVVSDIDRNVCRNVRTCTRRRRSTGGTSFLTESTSFRDGLAGQDMARSR